VEWNRTAAIIAGTVILAIPLAFILRREAYDPVKRIIDLAFSGLAALLLSPIILAASLAIKLDSKGPVFYPADRVGAKGRRIKVWKLRTMVTDADRDGRITRGNDVRITRVGRILRATKIDELPQLFNIILGTMSIVGPRPESANLVERHYAQKDAELFEIAPGLTCPGTLYYYIYDEDNQPPPGVSAEDYYAEVSLRTKLAADLHYVRHRCLAYDIKLIVLTVVLIVSKWLGRRPQWLPDNMRDR
jgi:lipopolysaccharide/colanic/teichoic acid biosynthesis glycosyltransferase